MKKLLRLVVGLIMCSIMFSSLAFAGGGLYEEQNVVAPVVVPESELDNCIRSRSVGDTKYYDLHVSLAEAMHDEPKPVTGANYGVAFAEPKNLHDKLKSIKGVNYVYVEQYSIEIKVGYLFINKTDMAKLDEAVLEVLRSELNNPNLKYLKEDNAFAGASGGKLYMSGDLDSTNITNRNSNTSSNSQPTDPSEPSKPSDK